MTTEPAPPASGAGAPDDDPADGGRDARADAARAAEHPVVESRPRRPRRRATTPPPSGSDPAPAPEPERHRLDENDDRLRAEKPPHY